MIVRSFSVFVTCKSETSSMSETRYPPRYPYRLDLKITASEQVLNARDLRAGHRQPMTDTHLLWRVNVKKSGRNIRIWHSPNIRKYQCATVSFTRTPVPFAMCEPS